MIARTAAPLLIASLLLPGSLLLDGCCWGNKGTANSGSTAAEEPVAEQSGYPAMPMPGPAPAFTPPGAIHFQLSNGIPVTLIEGGQIPIIRLQLNIYRGSESDPVGKGGLASFTASMLDEGAGDRDAVQISEALNDLASDLWSGADHEYSYAGVEALKDKLPQSLALLADVVIRPTFPAEDFSRISEERRNSLIAQKDQLSAIGSKAFSRLLYGDSYIGRPSYGALSTLDAITLEDVKDWHAQVWTPANAGLLIAGQINEAEAKAALDEAFGGWEAPKGSTLPAIPEVSVTKHEGTKVYWIDRPGAAQSFLMIGNSAPAFDPALDAERALGNAVLGGAFTARLNLNLREDKGYTYGARSRLRSERRGGIFYGTSSVKTDTTAPSITEILKELRWITGEVAEGEQAKPISETEFANFVSQRLQAFPSRFERISGILGQFAAIDAQKRPAGWLAGYAERTKAATMAGAQAQLDAIIDPSSLVIVVVGDYAVAGAAVEALKLGLTVMLDEEGRPVFAGAEGAQ